MHLGIGLSRLSWRQTRHRSRYPKRWSDLRRLVVVGRWARWVSQVAGGAAAMSPGRHRRVPARYDRPKAQPSA